MFAFRGLHIRGLESGRHSSGWYCIPRFTYLTNILSRQLKVLRIYAESLRYVNSFEFIFCS